MKIIAVTACPTGIAHTYMAAERLEKAAKNLGHSIKIETQGALGIENELNEEDVKNADGVVFAVGIPVQKIERFANLEALEVSVQEAIKRPEAVIAKLSNRNGT
jgi:PTS system fructose-specific IIB component